MPAFCHRFRFVIAASTDKVQLEAHDNFPGADKNQAPEQAYMTAWAANQTSSLSPFMDSSKPQLGVFNPACYMYALFHVHFLHQTSGYK